MHDIDYDNEVTQALKNDIKESGEKIRIAGDLNKHTEAKPLGEQGCAINRQMLMVFLGNIGTLSTGMALAMPTVTLNQLTDPNEPVHLSPSQASWFASMNVLSTPLGGLLNGYILDKLGRKCSLYVVNILAIVSWLLLVCATQNNPETVYILIMISRFLIGIVNGLATAPVGVYSAEISTAKIRGRLILGTSISIAAGITIMYALGYFIRNDWHLLSVIILCYQVIALVCVIPMPESPIWLLSKGRIAEAKKSLNYFRGQEKSAVILNAEVASEFHIMQKSIQLDSGENKQPFLKLLPLPEVYRPLLIMMTLFALQQLTGIFVVVVYAVQISEEAGVTIDPFMCAILIGLARLITTFPMIIILEKWGRRRAAMVSTIGMCITMLLLAANSWSEILQTIPFLSLIAIVSFIVLSTIGLYTLPFFMISELFPRKVRGPASGLTLAFGMFMSFLCVKMYPSLKNAIGNEYCFVIFAIMSFVSLIFVYLILPETRGRTLLEIEEALRKSIRPSRIKKIMPHAEV